MLVREAISFERYKDPKRALFGKKFGDNAKEAASIIQQLMTEIIESPKWKNSSNDLSYVESVWYDRYGGGYGGVEDTIQISVPRAFYSVGKEIKSILKQLGIKITGPMHIFVMGDYKHYEFPIEPLF